MKKLIVFLLIFPALLWGEEGGMFSFSLPTGERRLYIGLEAGYDHNWLYTGKSYRAFTEYDDRGGFFIGLPVRFVIFDWLAVQSGLQYIQKNYALKRTTPGSEVESTWTNHFLEFPFLATLSAGGQKLRGFVNAGLTLGVWLKSHIKGTGIAPSESPWGEVNPYRSYDEDVEWDSERDNRFDAALLFGGGIQYRMRPCIFYIEGRYYYGLTDLQKPYMDNMMPRLNDTFSIGAGVMFNSAVFDLFGRKK